MHTAVMARIPRPDWVDADPRQAEVLVDFLSELEGPWVWLFRSEGEIKDHSVGQFSALMTPEQAEVALRDPSWDVHLGGGGYGFTQYWEEDGKRTIYEKYPTEAELLVHYRSWHSVRPKHVELAEEFRLLFNLWEDRSTLTYYDFDESGNPIKAVEVSAVGVRALSSLVRRYQAAKQMYLALFVDSTLASAELPQERTEWNYADSEVVLGYHSDADQLSPGESFSRLLGKRLLAPPAIEESGVPPFDEQERDFEDFVIHTTGTGEDVIFTSDESRLANYFGANPDNPHYLTPVYFRREVLQKYYDSDLFTVEDGLVRCAGLWSLRIDNDQPNQVMAFLGDLGHLPRAEARYWRSFNIPPPPEGPSETLVKRAFAGQFADPKSIDLRFPRAYRLTNEAWEKAFGFLLFQPLHDDDRHVLSALHVPLTDTASEFDEQVLYLAKLLVDSINSKALGAALGEKVDSEKSLARLERFLSEGGAQEARAMLKAFADIQGLRSRGAAHLKGSNFDLSVAIGDADRRKGFEGLMTRAVETLACLQAFAEPATASDDQ